MTENTSSLKTGLAVAIGIALLLVSILFFGGDRALFKKYEHYVIRFVSTQGLNVGSIVSLAGVEVGNIEGIAFDENNVLIASVKIETRFVRLITDLTLATIRTQGALGDKYIYLTTPQKPGKRIPHLGEIKVDLEPDLLDMISGKTAEFSVLNEILNEMNQFLKNMNANGNSAHVIENVVETTQALTKLLNEPNVRDSFLHLKSILKKIDDGRGSLGKIVNDPSLHESMVRILGESPRNSYLKPLLREAIKQNENSK